jgi:hypothetical protein
MRCITIMEYEGIKYLGEQSKLIPWHYNLPYEIILKKYLQFFPWFLFTYFFEWGGNQYLCMVLKNSRSR